MKLAELYISVLQDGVERYNNHPELSHSYEIIRAIEILDEIKKGLEKTTDADDFPQEKIKYLLEPYYGGETPIIDCLYEEL